MKAITLFTGGGGVDVALQAAGYEVVAGLEYNPAIAAVANKNLGGHVRTGDILEASPANYPVCDLLHASPPCPSFSVAKANGKETERDIAMAEKVAEFIGVLLPKIFTLENVRGYRKSQSYGIIINALTALGYTYDARVSNSADFGVPQTRRRLIVRAVRGGFIPELPAPVRWVGWYEAVEDLLNTLPESKFADWQLKRLPESFSTFLLSNQMQKVSIEVPASTVTLSLHSKGKLPHAFLVRSANSKQEWGKGYKLPEEPTMTISRDGAPKAFLANESSTMEIREAESPAATQVSSTRNINQRAWLSQGRVVKMTTRCLARFQSFPDTYELSGNNALDCKIIGNACPPLMMQRIFEGLRAISSPSPPDRPHTQDSR